MYLFRFSHGESLSTRNSPALVSRWLLLVLSLALASCYEASRVEPFPEAAAPSVDDIRASRLFAGPGEFPPSAFAAYGIVAFRSQATPDNRDRYIGICEGYVASIPLATELSSRGIPLSEQMATVWPIEDSDLAANLNEFGDSPESCPDVVANIDTVTSLNVINAARRVRTDVEFSNPGPYLLAWSPAATVGDSDALVLVWDLSSVTTRQQATDLFADWAVEIENDPSLWRNGWDDGSLRRKLRLLADKWGETIIRAITSIGSD
jgi:hypothetical protein